jgi:hypothetical protein
MRGITGGGGGVDRGADGKWSSLPVKSCRLHLSICASVVKGELQHDSAPSHTVTYLVMTPIIQSFNTRQGTN